MDYTVDLDKKQFESIEGILSEELIELGVRCVLLIDLAGNIIVNLDDGDLEHDIYSLAALAAGNTVLAKPADQTPAIAMYAVRLMHEAGVPVQALQFVPGPGSVIGAGLTSDPRIAGVALTGSMNTAHVINRSLAAREAPLAAFIAETGGQNAMLVDSSALPQQVVEDVIRSAFHSAGQRCSALRVLFVQDDVADLLVDATLGGPRTARFDLSNVGFGSSHTLHELAERLYPKGAGAILSFGVKGGRAAGRRFIEAFDRRRGQSGRAASSRRRATSRAPPGGPA